MEIGRCNIIYSINRVIGHVVFSDSSNCVLFNQNYFLNRIEIFRKVRRHSVRTDIYSQNYKSLMNSMKRQTYFFWPFWLECKLPAREQRLKFISYCVNCQAYVKPMANIFRIFACNSDTSDIRRMHLTQWQIIITFAAHERLAYSITSAFADWPSEFSIFKITKNLIFVNMHIKTESRLCTAVQTPLFNSLQWRAQNYM